MSYKPRYIVSLGANPTTPGITTSVSQMFDGSVLTDRYIKQLTNALRKWGVLPRYGGMYQTALIAADHLKVKQPLGLMLRKWSEHAWISGPLYDTWPESGGPKEAWQEIIKLGDVRAQVAYAAGDRKNAWGYEQGPPSPSQWDSGRLMLAGWKQGELTPLRLALKEHALPKIPGYLEDVERIAAFLETRPKFEVQPLTVLGHCANRANPRSAIVK